MPHPLGRGPEPAGSWEASPALRYSSMYALAEVMRPASSPDSAAASAWLPALRLEPTACRAHDSHLGRYCGMSVLFGVWQGSLRICTSQPVSWCICGWVQWQMTDGKFACT